MDEDRTERSRRGTARTLAVWLAAGLLVACERAETMRAEEAAAPEAPHADPAPVPAARSGLGAAEERARGDYEDRPIAVAGTVLGEGGAPLPGAAVLLGPEHRVTTAADGGFVLEGLPRHNALLEIEAPGYRREMIPLHLVRPLDVARVTLDPLPLVPEEPDTVRFLFGGDTAFGRRFLDLAEVTPRDQVPADHPDALIQASDPEPGTRGVVQYLRPVFQEADYAVVNLETPVVADPATPYPYKDYVFFTLPGSLPALRWLGVDYVSLGNNHVYDYLDAGLVQTLAQLEEAGIAASGAGLTSERALQAHTVELRGQKYAFLSAASITGGQYPISFVADEAKGGAGNAGDQAALRAEIQRLKDAGYHPIVQLHTGNEYTYEPTVFASRLMQRAARAGAALVIGHHPHVAQGFATHDGTVVAHSLGNLFFDQDRLETMLSMLARIDMAGGDARTVRALPVYIEDYRPRPIAGALADLFLRRIAEVSPDLLVYPYAGQGWVALDPESAAANEREVEIEVRVPAAGSATLDLREWATSAESLATVSLGDAEARVQLGRDLMMHGGFEDWDLDEERLEAVRWDVSSGSEYSCLSGSYRGVAGLCITRSGREPGVVAFRNSIRVMGDALDQPNKDLTLLGYVRGQRAGPVRVIARYVSSERGVIFGEEVAYEHPGGSFGWQPFVADLQMPPDEPDPSLADAGPAGGALEIAASDVNLRSAPDLEAAVLMQLDQGDDVQERAREGEWIQVAVEGDREGWIHHSLVRAAGDPEEAAPTVARVQPRAVRLFLVLRPADGGGSGGMLNFDELALINWGEPQELAAAGGARFETPHPQDFLRLLAPPGEYRLRLTFRSYRPAAVPS